MKTWRAIFGIVTMLMASPAWAACNGCAPATNETWSNFVATAPLALPIGPTDRLGLVQGGITHGLLANSLLFAARKINTTAPLTGGGALTADLTLGITIPNANLLGGTGSNFVGITVGSGLLLIGNVLSATGSGGTVTSVTFTGDGTVLSSTPSAAVTTSGTLQATLNTQAANRVLAGPASGGAVAPTFRALVGADLPFPSASTLGGVESLAATTHQFLTSISTLGVPAAAQPACGDLSNAGALCPLGIGTNLSSGGGNLNVATATSSVLGVVRPDNTTITISAGVLTAVGGGGGSCPSGASGAVQYTNGSACQGNASVFSWDPTGQTLFITSVSALGNLGAIGLKLVAGNTNELGGLQIQEVGGSGSLINMGIEDNLDSNGIRGYINVIGGTGGTFGNLSLIPGGISNHCVAVAHDANGACTFSGFGDAGALLVEGTQGPGKPVVLLDQNGVRFWLGTQPGSATNDGWERIFNHDGNEIVDIGGSTTAHGGFLNLNNASSTSIIQLNADSTVLNYINATISFGADVRMVTLPTSCSGKVTGTVWNNSNVINLCP